MAVQLVPRIPISQHVAESSVCVESSSRAGIGAFVGSISMPSLVATHPAVCNVFIRITARRRDYYACYTCSGTANGASIQDVKSALMMALEGVNRGVFGVSSQKKAEIEGLLKSLEELNPSPRPAENLDTVELLDLAVKGTLNLLEAADKAQSVRRGVLISSVAAMIVNKKPRDETSCVDKSWWSDPEVCRQAGAWYPLSKTLVEQAAWDFVESTRHFDLVVLNPADEANAAIRYLEFCVQRQQNKIGAIHNLMLPLYAKQEDESALLLFLDSKYGKGRPGRPDIFYDPKYALRLCLEEERMRACVFIYGLMGMHEEAVSLALQIDPELAKREAIKVDDDEGLRKKLWLMVARHVIQQDNGMKAENIRMAVAFLKETNGLLKIEDILPFFPDFSLIDDFKEAICTSLEDYTKQIEEWKREMNDATHGADNIRQDINSLTQRYAIVNQNENCGICGKQILMTKGALSARPVAQNYASVMGPFYVFPCEHSFHAQCLTDYVIKHTNKFEGNRF